MTRNNRFRFLALVGSLALVVSACGGSSKSSSSSSSNNGSTKTLSAAPGFDPAAGTIHLGVITPLTGPVAVIGKPLTNGTETWFKKINDQGGIAGKYKVTLDEQDSQYVPQNGVQAYNSIKGNEVMIAQLLGTPVTKAVLPLLKQDGVIAAPASLDADWVHDANLLPVGGPYQIQMINAADYLLNEGGDKGKKMCSLVQDDAYGQAGQAGVDYAAKNMNFTLTTTAKFTAAAPDFTAQIQQLKSAGCEVVFLVATPSDVGKMFATSAQLQFAPQWLGQSPTWIGAFVASPLKDYFAAHFLLAAEGTEWGDTSVPGMKTMLDDVAKYAPSQGPDIYFVFGYYQAQAVSQILEKAVALGDLSRAGIQNAMAQVGTLTFNGLTGDYKYGKPEDREPPRSSTIYKVDPTKPGGLAKVKYNFTSDAAKSFDNFG